MDYTITVPTNLVARARKAFGARVGKPVDAQGNQTDATDQEVTDRLIRLFESEVVTGEDQTAMREAGRGRQPFKL
jgi:hypothetical protein